jgi:hypothetical protein
MMMLSSISLVSAGLILDTSIATAIHEKLLIHDERTYT